MISQSSHLTPQLPPLPTIRKAAAPLRRQVVDELRQSIIAGKLGPGARLVERELIGMMGVSRTVIREALRQLESEGLVAIIPNKGPIVRELTLDEAKDLYSIRAVLEGLAVRLFVQNAGNEEVGKLEKALGAVGEAYDEGDPEVVLETKNSFYDVLFEGAGSETLSSMIGGLHGRIWRWRAVGLGHPQRSAERSLASMRALHAMITAIKARNADLAEKIIRAEVTEAAVEVTRLLAERGLPATIRTTPRG
jgi:GntR family transcriptional regulator, trigonelline degradation regulator